MTKLKRGLRSKRFAAMLDAWRALPADRGGRGRRAPDRGGRRPPDPQVYRRMVRDGNRIDDSSPSEALHELRKRGKELRYLLELFGSPFPKNVSSRWSTRSRTSRKCSGATRTARCRSSCCARSARSSPPSPVAPPR